MKNWYAGGTGDQGTVIEESAGRTVAVTYQASDAPLAAAAPALLQLLRAIDQLPAVRLELRRSDIISGESLASDLGQLLSDLAESAR